jgi:hypothetical protein
LIISAGIELLIDECACDEEWVITVATGDDDAHDDV